jgi:DNA-binding transcriptional LysR family regulator
MLRHAQRLQVSRDDITREVADLSQGRVGYLRVGAGPGMAEDLLPATCGALLQDTTKVSFNITVATNDVLVPALRKGEYDLIVSGIPSSPHEDLVQEPLYEDKFAVVASARHRLAKRKSVSIANLSQEQWVLSATNVVSWRALHKAFEDYRLPPPRVALQSNWLPLKEIRVKELAWSRSVGVSYRRNAYVSPLARRFIEILKVTAKEIATEKR